MDSRSPSWKACEEKYRKYLGLPPYNTTSNPCISDGYFRASIERDFPEIYEAVYRSMRQEIEQYERRSR